MRIAQVAPLYESVPPKLYGGTERVVFYLTEELVRQGHDVTLFASGDSRTNARLCAPIRRALRLGNGYDDAVPYHMVELEEVGRQADAFDVIHFHTDYLHFPLTRRLATPHVTTMHGRLDLRDLPLLYKEFRDVPLVSISDAQRRPLSGANWLATVYHGLPIDAYRLVQRPEGYLAFLGRIAPEKRPDRAIEIARRAGIPLKIAAKVDRADRRYYEERIKPLLAGGGVEFIGEIGEEDKNEFLGNALALLFPIDWPEPFGLVMIEAMACGTPVLAFRGGSVDEVVDEGVTGVVVEDVDAAVAAVDRIATLDRSRVRRRFERRFSVARMASEYLEVYRRAGARLFRSRAA